MADVEKSPRADVSNNGREMHMRPEYVTPSPTFHPIRTVITLLHVTFFGPFSMLISE